MMTNLMKHGDTISFNYLDPFQGLQVASWAVHSAVTNALAIGGDPVETVKRFDGRETVTLVRVPTSGVAAAVPSRLLIEGKIYTVVVEGPMARLERIG